MNILIIVLYLIALVAFGYLGKKRAHNAEDFRVAGRRLGPVLYTGTMSALLLGGASTVGGVGLGYTYGISGMWLVTAIGVGMLLLSLIFAPVITRVKLYTVSQVLTLRYGVRTTQISSIVMLAYTVMLTVTSTAAYASIFRVLFDVDRTWAILLGAMIVIGYSMLGGMWSITLTDMMQFILMTVGVFFLLLPFSLHHAGGWDGLHQRLDAEFFAVGSIGTESIITYFVIYTFGLLVGQDIWQRVFTARSPEVSRWGGTAASIYVIIYSVAGAIIGMCARVIEPHIEHRDDVFATLAQNYLPIGIGGVVLAAGVAAMMSTASGSLIASATVARVDVVPFLLGKDSLQNSDESSDSALVADRWYVLGFGVITTVIALFLTDAITGLTIAYDILVGGLLVAILGGLLWKRGTGTAAALSMAVGSIGVILGMVIYGVMANEPIYIGLVASFIVYIVASLLTKPTDPQVAQRWQERIRQGA
ncbi:sodium:solute symporter [Rothia sp. CCM 9419]|uniref:sodium:solute symporter n=1 Tax=Rothia sp. CCM 9419 TaxID=3402662 RepID=UPI003AE6AFA7